MTTVFGTVPHIGPRHVEQITDTARQVFAPGSFWNTQLPDTVALDATSLQTGTNPDGTPVLKPVNPAVATDLARQAKAAAPYVNTWQYTAEMLVVPPDQPLVPVLLRGARTDPPWLRLKEVFATGIPIPAGWAPQADTDAEGSFYQPDYVSPNGAYKGRLYEVWKMQAEDPALTGGFSWSCSWGGRMSDVAKNPGHWNSWQYSGYRYQTPGDPNSTWQDYHWGATATSLPLIGGTITWEETQLGRIEHALGLSVISPRKGYAGRWPAQRSDGGSTTNPVIEGMRMRFPAGSVAPASLHPVAKLIYDAVRDYGLVIWDMAGSLSFRAEPRCADSFAGVPGYKILDGFPWADLQVIATGSDTTPNP